MGAGGRQSWPSVLVNGGGAKAVWNEKSEIQVQGPALSLRTWPETQVLLFWLFLEDISTSAGDLLCARGWCGYQDTALTNTSVSGGSNPFVRGNEELNRKAEIGTGNDF